MGDMTKDEYTYKRQILEQELAALEPPVVSDAEEAAAALTNFALFWERERDAKKRNRLLRTIFQSLGASHSELVAVTPREAFLPRAGTGTPLPRPPPRPHVVSFVPGRPTLGTRP